MKQSMKCVNAMTKYTSMKVCLINLLKWFLLVINVNEMFDYILTESLQHCDKNQFNHVNTTGALVNMFNTFLYVAISSINVLLQIV